MSSGDAYLTTTLLVLLLLLLSRARLFACHVSFAAWLVPCVAVNRVCAERPLSCFPCRSSVHFPGGVFGTAVSASTKCTPKREQKKSSLCANTGLSYFFLCCFAAIVTFARFLELLTAVRLRLYGCFSYRLGLMPRTKGCSLCASLLSALSTDGRVAV